MVYDELVKRLRYCSEETSGCGLCALSDNCVLRVGLILQAADAIEVLIRRETPVKITEIHVDEYYCPACGAENNCDQGRVQDAYCPACGQRLLSDLPKEET